MLFRWVNMIYPYNQQAGGLSLGFCQIECTPLWTHLYTGQKEERFELLHIQLKVKSAI